MSVHYKFKSSLEYDTVTFDGLHISVGDLKKSIVQQKKLGKATDFDLLITNAQTQDVYEDDNILIPKNTSVTVARVPIPGATNKKVWDRPEPSLMQSTVKAQPFLGHSDGPPTSDALGSSADKLAQAVDLSSIEASEEEKIKAMMAQSTQEYDPSKYVKIRGSNQVGAVPANYCCFKCGQPGHWIKNCPFTQANIEVRKSTGIPRSFMVPVEGPTVPGAMMTPSGVFAVNIMDHEAYKDHQADKQRFTEDSEEPEGTSDAQPEIPADLMCGICKDLLSEAVLVPCCGESFCDECVRTTLLESEEHTCPSCHEKNVSPDTLIPNRFLRTAVANFQKETGYSKLKLNGSAAPEEAKEEAKREAAETGPAAVVLNILHEDSNLEPVSDDDMKDLGDGFDVKETEPEEEERKDSPSVERKEKVIPESEASPAALSPRPGSETRVPTPTVDEKPAAGASPRSREKKFPPQRGPPLQNQSVPPLMPQGAISIQQLLAGSPLLLGSQLAMLQQGILAMQRLPMVNPNMPGGHGPGPGGLHHHQPPQLNHYNPLHHGPPRMPYMPPSGPPPQPPSRNMHQGSNQFPPQMPYGSSSHGHSHYSGSSGFGPGPGYGNQYDRNGGGSGFRSEASSAAAAIAQHPLLQHGVVEDPLAAFERMLKEKEERDRVRKMKRRSYSGSVSKSRSRSPAPKMKRSSISRSRDRSLTPSNRRQNSRSRSPAKRARSPLRKRRSRSRMGSRSRSRSRSPRRRTRSPRRSRSLVRSRSRSPRPFRYERDYPAFRDNAGGFPPEMSGFPPLPGRDDALLRGMPSMEPFPGAEAYGGRPPAFSGHDLARDKRTRDGGSYEYRRDYAKGYYEDAARCDDYRSREERQYREAERSKERLYASKEREREDRSRRVERERGARPRDHKAEHPSEADVVSKRKRSRTPKEASPAPVSHAKHATERESDRASYDAAVSPSSRGRAASSEAVEKRQRKESESKLKDARVVEDLRPRDDESVEKTEKAKKEKKKKRKKDKRSAEVEDEEDKSRTKKKKEKHRKRSPNLKSDAMDDKDLETGHSKVNKDPDVTFVNPSPPGPPGPAPEQEEFEAMDGGSELSGPSVVPEQRSALADDSADAFESSMEALEKSNKWRPLQLATPPSHGNGKAEEEVDDVLTLHPKEDDLTIDTDALGRFPAPKPHGEEKRERSPAPEVHRKDSRKHYSKEEKTASKSSKSKSSGRGKEDPAASSHTSLEAPYAALPAAAVDTGKRSDNAIFKRAISAIKPIEIKPLKLFLADREKPKDKEKERHRTLSDRETQLKEARSASKPRVLDRSRFVLDRNPTPPKDSVASSDLSNSRVSAKERLGEKIDLAGRKPSKERSRSRERKHGSSRKGEEHHSHSQTRHAEDSSGRRVENPGKAETPELAHLLTEESSSKGDAQKRESRRSPSVASSSAKRKKSKSKKRKRSASTASSGSNSDSSSEDEKARKKKAKKSKKTKKAKKHKHS